MSRGPGEKSAQRLFFALWPDPIVRSELDRLRAHVPERTGRLVSMENLHLTLAFLGHIGCEARACMESVADGVVANGFELAFTRLGYWPRPRVFWAGTGSEPDALIDLVSRLRAAMTRCGLAPESRPYRAHVTLARNVRLPGNFQTSCDPVIWRVDAFHLIESKTLSAGASYRSLRAWSLRV